MSKTFSKYIGWILLSIGISFLLVSYFSNNIYHDRLLSYDKVVGKIVDIKVVRGKEKPIVAYQVDNQEYKCFLEYYSPDFKVGDKTGLLVNPNDPKKVDDGKNDMTLISGCSGMVFAILGCIFIKRKKKKIIAIEEEIDV